MENNDEQLQHIKGAIEALLFVNERPVTLEQIKKVFDTVGVSELKKALKQLDQEHKERKSGMNVVEIAGGYQMLSNKIYADYIRNFYKTRHKAKLSKPSLETLAIVAYKQPVTRNDIELIRGVNSDGVVTHLLEKELIKIVGRKSVPGKPYLYGTTKQFMEYFGLKSLDDLPKLEEFPKLQPEYEKESEDHPSSDESQISAEAVAKNSMEEAKQAAIVEANNHQSSKESDDTQEEAAAVTIAGDAAEEQKENINNEPK